MSISWSTALKSIAPWKLHFSIFTSIFTSEIFWSLLKTQIFPCRTTDRSRCIFYVEYCSSCRKKSFNTNSQTSLAPFVKIRVIDLWKNRRNKQLFFVLSIVRNRFPRTTVFRHSNFDFLPWLNAQNLIENLKTKTLTESKHRPTPQLRPLSKGL